MQTARRAAPSIAYSGNESITFLGTEVQLEFSTVLGKLYCVEHTPSLDAGSWHTVATGLKGGGGPLGVRLNAGEAQPHGFYRVRLAP